MRNFNAPHQQGFTIVELMFALAVAAVLLTVGIPKMNGMLEGRNLVGQATETVTAFSYARAEAAARSQNISVCSSSDTLTCSGSRDWSNGWIIFTDKNADLVVTGNQDEILKAEKSFQGGVTLVANVPSVTFGFNGESLANSAVVFNLCAKNATAGAATDFNLSRQVTINKVGSANVSIGNATCS